MRQTAKKVGGLNHSRIYITDIYRMQILNVSTQIKTLQIAFYFSHKTGFYDIYTFTWLRPQEDSLQQYIYNIVFITNNLAYAVFLSNMFLREQSPLFQGCTCSL